GTGATLQAQTANALAGATINLNGGSLSLRADAATTFAPNALNVTGNSTIDVNRLVSNAGAQVLTLSPTTLNLAGTLNTTDGNVDSLILGTNATLTADTTVNTLLANMTFGGTISGAFKLTKAGTAQLTLTQENPSWTGGLEI